jgi:DNA-binding FrmR family transcriptional regulator
MIEDDRWCPDVVIQVASTTRALQEVAIGLLSDHLRHCVMSTATAFAEERDTALEEVAATIRQVIRL